MRSASIAAARWRLPICQARLGEMNRIAAANFQQLLFRGDDLGVAPILQHQHVAVFERDRLGKVDENAVAMGERDDLAPEMALILRQHGNVERNLRAAGRRRSPRREYVSWLSAWQLPSQAIVSNRRRIHDAW